VTEDIKEGALCIAGQFCGLPEREASEFVEPSKPSSTAPRSHPRMEAEWTSPMDSSKVLVEDAMSGEYAIAAAVATLKGLGNKP